MSKLSTDATQLAHRSTYWSMAIIFIPVTKSAAASVGHVVRLVLLHNLYDCAGFKDLLLLITSAIV